MKHVFLFFILPFSLIGCMTVSKSYTDFNLNVIPKDNEEFVISFNETIILQRESKTEVFLEVPKSKENATKRELKKLLSDKTLREFKESSCTRKITFIKREDNILYFLYEKTLGGNEGQPQTESQALLFDSNKSNIFECDSAKIQILYGTKDNICYKILKNFDSWGF